MTNDPSQVKVELYDSVAVVNNGHCDIGIVVNITLNNITLATPLCEGAYTFKTIEINKNTTIYVHYQPKIRTFERIVCVELIIKVKCMFTDTFCINNFGIFRIPNHKYVACLN